MQLQPFSPVTSEMIGQPLQGEMPDRLTSRYLALRHAR